MQLLCYAIENVNTTSGSKNLFLLSLIRIEIMPTKIYVHPSGQFPRHLTELSKQHGVLMETSSASLSSSQLRKYDGLLYVNPVRSLTQEEKLAALRFSAEGGGIAVNLYANGIADFEKRLKDPFWQALFGSVIAYVDFNPFSYRLTDTGEPLEIESFFIDEKTRKSYDTIKTPLTELKVDKDDIEIKSAWVSNPPFDFPESQKVDVGDQHRTEGELLILQSDSAKPILTREIHPADRMRSPRYVEILLQESLRGRYISDESFEAIKTAFNSEKNSTHVVGVLNERIDLEYASSFGKEIVPTGLVAGFVGSTFADRYADKNVHFLSKILKHLGSLRKDLIRETPEERSEVQPPEQSENPTQQGKHVTFLKDLYTPPKE